MNRTLLLGAAWTASAGAAVGLGFLAVSLVDASASPVVRPVASGDLVTEGAPSSESLTASPAATGEQATPGGTVFASCGDGSSVPVLSGAPAAGWWVDDTQQPGRWEFQSASQSIEVRATCVGGTPRFVVEGPRGGRETPRVPGSAPDDSTGRVNGGHGSDDPPGDDHGGSKSSSGSDDSRSGGHGSDD